MAGNTKDAKKADNKEITSLVPDSVNEKLDELQLPDAGEDDFGKNENNRRVAERMKRERETASGSISAKRDADAPVDGAASRVDPEELKLPPRPDDAGGNGGWSRNS